MKTEGISTKDEGPISRGAALDINEKNKSSEPNTQPRGDTEKKEAEE